MRRFWLFRSDIKDLEYYHKYTELNEFKEKCHDYYLLLPLWLLENNHYDEVTIWRLSHKPKDPIVFDVNGKKFIQRWCLSFKECFKFPSPEISFFRGGFKEYDQVTKSKPEHFGLKLYLGAGKRITPIYGGIYDVILMEDSIDLKNHPKSVQFYKTASPSIFHPIDGIVKIWDICWPCNFTQLSYKGQELFIKSISKSTYLQKLRIVHCGNKPNVGKSLCEKYKVSNINFLGPVERERLNKVLNQSWFGLNLSNRTDGCPRVSTEILMSGTPLIIRDITRILPSYKNYGCVEVSEHNLPKKIEDGFDNFLIHKSNLLKAIDDQLSFDSICAKNVILWKILQER
jgi:hypothetical protein